jgi:hypothetical protein
VRSPSLIAVVSLVTCLSGGTVNAQKVSPVTGTVRSTSAEPIVGARVELWSTDSRLGSTITNGKGDFQFEGVENAIALVGYALGFSPATVRLDTLGRPIQITLQPHVYDLPAVEVKGNRSKCPAQSEQRAIAALEEMQTRYDQPGPAAQIAAGFYSYQSTVPLSEFGKFDERSSPFAVRTARPAGQRITAVADSGFATPVAAGASHGDPGNWNYADLGGTEAYLFLTREFKKFHTFTMLSSDSAETIIGFCPVEKGKPALRGMLRLDGGMTLRSASWQFVVPRSDEKAVGEAVFSPVGYRKGFLTPVSSTFGTASRMVGYYRQRLERYAGWAVGSQTDIRAMMKSWYSKYNGPTK